MPNHTPPIVPHVLYVADQHHPWQLAPIERLATRYHTPTTVALAFGTIDATVKPQTGKSGATKQQYHVWCVPNDAAWQRIERARADLQLAIDALADELRRLGSYATRLAAAGGLKAAPNPLCPTVISASDPDSTDTSWWTAHPIPRIDRSEISDHTPKMLHITRDGQPWSTTHQRDHFVCPDDAAWQAVQDYRALAEVAHTRWQALLSELGTYQQALADGRYAGLAQSTPTALVPAAPLITGVPMMDAAEARDTLNRMAGDLEQVDVSIASFRQKALDFAEREGWKALGYSGSAEAINAELGTQYSKSYLATKNGAASNDTPAFDSEEIERVRLAVARFYAGGSGAPSKSAQIGTSSA